MLYLCIYIVVYFVITYTGIKMSISVIEGNYIKMGNNCNEIEQDAMNLTGYLRISVKKNNGGFEDGYIFMKKGQKIGYYHEDGMEESTGKKAEELINKMKEQEHTVEVYEYDYNKLNLMKEMFGAPILNISPNISFIRFNLLSSYSYTSTIWSCSFILLINSSAFFPVDSSIPSSW